jgi:hypothetical protein
MDRKVILTMVTCLIVFHSMALSSNVEQCSSTYLLSNPEDPYYVLCQEISEKENLPVINEINELKNYNIQYLLWVISPGKLSENLILDYAKAVYSNDCFMAMGIISGRNINQARILWQNSKNVACGKRVVLNAALNKNKVPSGISVYESNRFSVQSFTKENIIDNLKDAQYIQVNMHGAAQSWFCEKSHLAISNNNIPNMRGAVIESQTCNNFIPWNKKSMVLECIEKGAIAFTGFVYSPVSGSQLGAYDGLMFTNTWEGFTIGHAVQIQNRAALRSYAKLPHYFLMGDPRTYLSKEKPYELLKDTITRNRNRIIQLTNCKAGFLPIRVPGSKKYSDVKISSGIRHLESSNYFDRDIEMINIGEDKFIMVRNNEPELTISLSEMPPFLQKIWQRLINWCDTKIYYRHQEGLYLVTGLLFLIIYFIQFLRQEKSLEITIFSFLTALALIFAPALTDLIRLSHISVTSKDVPFNTFNYLGIFLLFFVGSAVFYKSDIPKKKIWAIIIMCSSQILQIVILSVLQVVGYFLVGNEHYNIQKTSYYLSISRILEVIISIAILYLILSKVQKWIKTGSLKK